MTEEDFSGRQPADLTAELNILGAVMASGRRVLDELADIRFDPADFYAPKHETVFQAAVALSAAGEPVEMGSVAAKLGQDLTRIGGPAFLHDALRVCVSPASATFYARRVSALAAFRRLASAGQKAKDLGVAADGDVVEAVDMAQAELAKVAESVHGGQHTEDMGVALDDLLERIESGGAPTVPTGIRELDRIFLGGLQVGTLTTIAARPGVGKTVVGLQVALNMAVDGSAQVGYTSLEMSREDLLLRAVSSLEKVDYGRLQKSPDESLTDSEWRAVRRGTERIRDSGLLVTKRTKASAAAVRSDIRSMIRRRGSCSAWVVDYLGLVTPADVRVIREQQVAGITRSLKQTALETGVPIVLLCQLGREGEKAGRPPIITDLRESGAIEQDSDNVILLHRDQEKRPDVLAAKIAKCRRGPLADFVLTFEGSYQRVKDTGWSPSNQAERNLKAVP